MVGNGPHVTAPLPARSPDIDLAPLGDRLAAIPGIERVRAAAGGRAYLVGGAVRDLLLGLERADIDVAVEGDVEEIAGRLGGEARSHPRFATVSVRLDELELDLTATRAETYPRPGALPEVRPASLADDLARRDFTVNAMALPLAGETALIDPHGGLADLRAGLLRVLHARSFVDDPTRAIRAARYAARLGLAPEPETERLLRAADLATVSADRVEAELRKLAGQRDPGHAFELLRAWGVVDLPSDGPELARRAGELADRPPWQGAVARADTVLAAGLGRMGEARRLAELRPSRPSEGVAAAHGRTPVELALARALGAGWLDDYVQRWRSVRLEVGGADLLAAGVEQGPAVGRGLAAALRAKLDGEVEGRDAELDVAVAAAREPREMA